MDEQVQHFGCVHTGANMSTNVTVVTIEITPVGAKWAGHEKLMGQKQLPMRAQDTADKNVRQ